VVHLPLHRNPCQSQPFQLADNHHHDLLAFPYQEMLLNVLERSVSMPTCAKFVHIALTMRCCMVSDIMEVKRTMESHSIIFMSL
jgi:hypothetical protein